MRAGTKRIAAVLTALLICASAAPATVRPIVIGDDPGGFLNTYLDWYARLRDSGVPVRIRGLCVSACTYVLTLPKEQVCIEPTAAFGFHLASWGDTPDPGLTQVLNRRWYPPAVLAWLVDKKMRERPIYMQADEIVALGIFPACDASGGEE